MYFKMCSEKLLSSYAVRKLQSSRSKIKSKKFLESHGDVQDDEDNRMPHIQSSDYWTQSAENCEVSSENCQIQRGSMIDLENDRCEHNCANQNDSSHSENGCSDNDDYNKYSTFIENSAVYDQRFDEVEDLHERYYIPDDLFNSDVEVDDENQRKLKPQTLEELLNMDGFAETIVTPTKTSPLHLLFLIIRFSVMNKLSVSTLSGLLTLVNSIFKDPIFPESRYMIDKFFNGNPNTYFYAICPNEKCKAHLGKLEDLDVNSQCRSCNKLIGKIDHASDNFYVMIDPSEGIINALKSNEKHYDYVVNHRIHEIGHYKDIYDGYLYQKFVSSLSPEDQKQYVTVTFNSDGAAPFKSSPLSVWPIYLMVNEIPPQERFKNIITCAIWFNRKKPDMKSFLKEFVLMINNISNKGISCTIMGKKLDLKLYSLVCCVDSVARAPMQGLTQFNGKFGCNWCLHPTTWCKSSKYPIKIIPLRTVEGMLKDIACLRHKYVSHGVKSATPLLKLNRFDIIEGFTPDYMHCVLAGVAKQISGYFINNENSDFYQEYLNKMKFPHQVCRITRPLSYSKYWKCREWENWILYASLPLFSLTLEQDDIEYWALLVRSLFILLKVDITDTELDRADEMLYYFVTKTQEKFKIRAMTFNMHQLLHICKSVKNWGPLWAHSAFAFESGNHELLQAIHSGRGVISQILRYININQCSKKIEKQIFPENCEILNKYCINKLRTKVKKTLKLSNIRYFGKGVKTSELYINTYNLPSQCKSYRRMIKNNCTYVSNLKACAKSDNSKALLTDGSFVELIEFFVDEKSKTELTLCRIIKISKTSILGNNISKEAKKLKLDEIHLKQVSSTQIKNVMVIPTASIESICVYIIIDDKAYICPTPNLYYY
ncbi:hypothetical protein TKK_0000292 [Trichogramma kaykai]